MQLPLLPESNLQEILLNAIEKAIKKMRVSPQKEWMTLKEAAEYADVSFNTLNTFRLHGLKVCEIGRVKRVSKTEMDRFLNSHSF